MLLATALGKVLELINHHHKLGHINAVTQGLQGKGYLNSKAVFKLNKIEDLELNFAVAMIKEGVSRLTTEATKLDKLFEFAANIGDVASGLYNKQLGAAIISTKKIIDEIGKNFSSKWYDGYLVVEGLSRRVISTANIDSLCVILLRLHESNDFELKAAGAQLLGEIIALSKDATIQEIALNGVTLQNGKEKTFLPGLTHYANYDQLVKKGEKVSDKKLTIYIYAMSAVAKLMRHAKKEVASSARQLVRTLFREKKPALEKCVEAVQRSLSDPRVVDWLTGNISEFPLPAIDYPRSPSTSKGSSSSSNSNSPVSQIFVATYQQQHTPPSPPTLLMSPIPSVSLNTAPVTPQATQMQFQWPSEFLKMLVPGLTFAQATKMEDVAPKLIKGLSAKNFVVEVKEGTRKLWINKVGMSELAQVLKGLPLVSLDLSILGEEVEGLDLLAEALPMTSISHVTLACPLEKTDAVLLAKAVEEAMSKGKQLTFSLTHGPRPMARLAQALGKLGYQNLEKQYYINAIQVWKYESVKVEEIRESLAIIYLNLGNIHASDGELDKAINCEEIALGLRPNDHDAAFNLAQFYARKTETLNLSDIANFNHYYDKAINLMQQLIKTNPEFGDYATYAIYLYAKNERNGMINQKFKAELIKYFEKTLTFGEEEKIKRNSKILSESEEHDMAKARKWIDFCLLNDS